jgi:hypothetical protein
MFQIIFGIAVAEAIVLGLLVVPYAPAVLVRGILALLFAVRWYSTRAFVFLAGFLGWQVRSFFFSRLPSSLSLPFLLLFLVLLVSLFGIVPAPKRRLHFASFFSWFCARKTLTLPLLVFTFLSPPECIL